MDTKWTKRFAIFYLGQAFSILGSSIVQFAIIWWITMQTESAVSLTLATIVAVIPNIILGPFAGVWVDRYNRKLVMIYADGLVALASLVLALGFIWMDVPPLEFIHLIIFIRGIGSVFHDPAMQAAIPQLVPKEMLTKAGGWGNLVTSFSQMLGPILGALLLDYFSMEFILAIDVIGAAFAIMCLLFIFIPNTVHESGKINFVSDIKEGFRVMKENKPLYASLPTVILCNIINGPLIALLPLLVRTHFLGTAWHNSIVRFSISAGLLISSFVIGIWGGMKNRFFMVAIAICTVGLAITLGGLVPINSFWLFLISIFILGFGITFINIPIMAYTQETISEEVLGKVISLEMTIITITMPLGLIIAGPLSEVVGLNHWFFFSGLAMILTGVLFRVHTKKYDDITRVKEKE